MLQACQLMNFDLHLVPKSAHQSWSNHVDIDRFTRGRHPEDVERFRLQDSDHEAGEQRGTHSSTEQRRPGHGDRVPGREEPQPRGHGCTVSTVLDLYYKKA